MPTMTASSPAAATRHGNTVAVSPCDCGAAMIPVRHEGSRREELMCETDYHQYRARYGVQTLTRLDQGETLLDRPRRDRATSDRPA